MTTIIKLCEDLKVIGIERLRHINKIRVLFDALVSTTGNIVN